MRILHLINTLEMGGAQSVLFQLVSDWNNSNDEQVVVSLREEGELSKQFEKNKIPVTHINMNPGKIKPSDLFRIIRVMREFNPDVIQTWLYHSDLIGSFCSLFSGRKPVIWGVHHTTNTSSSVKKSTWFVIKILSLLSAILPSKIIYCSDSAFEAHLKLGYPIKKSIKIYNGIDTEKFRPDKIAKGSIIAEIGVNRESILIGMFARFHPQKDYPNLLRAAKLVIKNNKKVHFVLSGKEINYQNLELYKMIMNMGFENHIHLLGSRMDMPRLLAGMDIVTLSAAYGEALPQVLGEAMACGIPVVATNVGDIPNLLGKSGIIVQPRDPKALANGLMSIINLSETENSSIRKSIRMRIVEKFSTNKMIFEYNKVYKNQ